MKKLTFAVSSLLAVIALFCALGLTATSAQAAPSTLHISWDNPTDSENGLVRAIGDAGIWTFNVQLDPGVVMVAGPNWEYPGGNGADPDWGVWGINHTTLSWSAPDTGGSFTVTVSGRIRKKTTGNGGGFGVVEEKDFNATWEGEMEGPCPIDLWHEDLKCKEVRLVWDKCKDAPNEFTSYTIYGPSLSPNVNTTSGGVTYGSRSTTSHFFEDLEPSTTYYFVLKVAHGGEVTTHNETVITPDADVSVAVRRKGTGTWVSSATVSAGGRDSDEHKGEIKITVLDTDDTPLEGQTVSVISGDGVTLDSNETNANGIVTGTYLSDEYVKDVLIEIEAGQGGSIPPSATFSHKWNKDAQDGTQVSTAPWETLGYFIPGIESPITYVMKLDDGAAITKHQLGLETTKLTGIEWDASLEIDFEDDGIVDQIGGYVPGTYTKKDDPELQPGGKYSGLTVYDAMVEGSSGGILNGRYATSLTAGDYMVAGNLTDYYIDEVHFQAKDGNVKRIQSPQ